MEIQGYFTQKGLALSAKLLTGTALTITRVVAGAGSISNPAAATSLSQPKQTLAANTPTRSGSTATIPVTLAAAQADGDYTLTELGVYAQDPEEGEILYKMYRLSEPVDITAGSRMMLRFYLEETVSQDLNVTVVCSPAGLITEADFEPVRSVVEKTNAPTRYVRLAVSELQAFLDGLPRLLTEGMRITVSGTLDTSLSIHDFYGSGILVIAADSTSGCTFQNVVTVTNCHVQVEFQNINMTAPAGMAQNTGLFAVDKSFYTRLWKCILTGHEKETKVYGIGAGRGSRVICEDCSVNSFYGTVLSATLASVSICGSASDYSDNTIGAYVWYGGTVMLDSNIPDALGGSANIKDGGMIVKADGTLL